MIKSKLTYNQMADVLDKTADAMEQMVKGHNAKIHMHRGYLYTKDEHLNCETPACVGGWLTLLSGLEYPIRDSSHLDVRAFEIGANWFAKKLGFPNLRDLAIFFKQRPELWGNDMGAVMFVYGIAYNEETFERLESTTIARVIHKWRETAKRMRLASRKRSEARMRNKLAPIPIVFNIKRGEKLFKKELV